LRYSHPSRPVVFDPPYLSLRFDPFGGDKPWMTVGTHNYRDGMIVYSVPSGFRTDLDSVPSLLRILFPSNGRFKRAALFHDFAYRQQKGSRFTADAMFRTIMQRDGVAAWRVLLMYYGVRLFGGFAWRSNRK